MVCVHNLVEFASSIIQEAAIWFDYNPDTKKKTFLQMVKCKF